MIRKRPLSVIALGKINTDIFVLGVPRFPKKGESVRGEKLKICAGGKARNAAHMMATLLGPGVVAMISRTIRDPLRLWEIPLKALKEAGVDVRRVTVLPQNSHEPYPPLAVIAVDEKGNNQIYAVSGPSGEVGPQDVEGSLSLFKEAGAHQGLLVLSLELPMETATISMRLARRYGLRVVLDAGGIHRHNDFEKIFREDVYLLKPNEHEARQLSGVEVKDFDSARQAAAKILRDGVRNLLFTAGQNGAYLFTPEGEESIPIPKLDLKGPRDETGCGDQLLATLCAMLLKGKGMSEAARVAVTAATLEFYKAGIDPVTPKELAPFLKERSLGIY